MIRFLLNSGGVYSTGDRGKKYINDALSDKGSNPKILICLFPLVFDDWFKRYDKYKVDIDELAEDRHPIYDLAFPDTFATQCSWADVVIIHGGDDHLTMFWLQQFDLRSIWEGKTIAAQSASIDALSSSFWTCNWRRCFNGLGIVPLRFLTHYNSNWGLDDHRGPIDWQAARRELEQYGDVTHPVYALEEGEYIEYILEQ